MTSPERELLTLGIESSCDDSAVALLRAKGMWLPSCFRARLSPMPPTEGYS
jgi:tRNA A37 threonylcarbamoyltransferase TsaD